MNFIKILLILTTGILFSRSFSQNLLEIPDNDWRLWPDTTAAWENDDIYLPDDYELADLPIHPPTGGWTFLNKTNGIEVTLPATVEQYFWGNFGFRTYDNEYYFEEEDPQVKNGNYRGVSWWWTEVNVPESFKDKKVNLHIRGARLRAEVYVNQQLVGYHIITETSFSCEISQAIRPGEKNLLAIRITNPGGQMDWVDTRLHRWGEKQFHMGHGFGGLDRGLFFLAHDPIYVENLWVLNTPEIFKIRVRGEVQNRTANQASGELQLEVWDLESQKKLKSTKRSVTLTSDKVFYFDEMIDCPSAKIWDLNQPKLYQLKVILSSKPASGKKKWTDVQTKSFGFRWFEADGVGKNAVLCLNGKRIRLISAISWGFWGLNGLWPTPELAEKEVLAAKSFGINCLQFHRNVGKAEVLEAQDRLGLLRYMEPGGGQSALGEVFSLYADSPEDTIDTTGREGEPKTFAEKYMEEKIIRMIRDHRSHPSLIIYCIQNEINPDLNNPRIHHLLRRMHEEDPSRVIMLKSGIPPENQAWMKPYENTIYFDQGNSYSGWWDRHTVGGPGVWQDNMYQNDSTFTHHSDNLKEIVTWGEMLGAAVPDNQVQMIKTIQTSGGKSYDLTDHQEMLNAYENFLDKWNFRTAFPTAEDLFLSIGDKSYDFWGRVIETARLAESNDFLVISGWESTAMENHSGLVDNLREFKGNPELLKNRLALLRPVIKPKSLVIAQGNTDTLDLFIINETAGAHPREFRLTLMDPAGNINDLGSFRPAAWEKDQFVYPLAATIVTPALSLEGFYTFKLTAIDRPELNCQEKILVIQPYPKTELTAQVGVVTHEPQFINLLNEMPGIQAEVYHKYKNYDLIIASTRLLHGWRSEVDSTTEIAKTDDDILFHTESWGYWRNLEYVFTNLSKGKARITLRFAEVTLKNPGDRIMNVAINGDTVLKDFDIVATVGGPNIAMDTVFTVDTPDGAVKITVPKLTVNYAKFSAIKIEAGDTIIAINCGGKPYRDKNGLLWDVYGQEINLDDEIISRVKAGTPLLILPDGQEAAEAYGKKLAEAGAFNYLGHVGNVRASWMGAWFFVREHPVFAGMPVNQAMRSYYQVPVSGSDGLLLDGDRVEVFAGYGRDHDRNIGAASFTASIDQGKILWHSLPGMVSGLSEPGRGMQPVLLKRLLKNSINFLVEK